MNQSIKPKLEISELTLFVAENCHDCDKVMLGLANRNISIPTYNVDLQSTQPPIKLNIFPALMQKNRLLAYGLDILDMLAKE